LRSRSLPAFLVAVACAAGSTARGQSVLSLNRSGSGARAAGMANAFVAVSDDGTAASWNPAGLAQLRKPELSAVYSISDRAVRLDGLRSLDGRWAYSPRDVAATTASMDFGSLAIPFTVAGRPVTVQGGWRRLYQLSGTFEGTVFRRPFGASGGAVESFTFRQDRTRGDVDLLSLAGAVRLTRRTLLGGSIDHWRGDWNDLRAVAGDREPGAGSVSDFVALSADHRVRGNNYSVGLLLDYPAWKVGLVYHSPFWASYRLQQEFRSNLAPTLTEDTGPEARFRFPRSIAAGVAWRPAPRWTIALDATHDEWSDFLIDRIPGLEGPVNFFDGEPPGFTSTRDTLSFNAGAEHLFQREGAVIPVRAGIAWEPQGPMDRILRDPVDYVMVAAGAGFNTNSFKFDAAVQYRWGRFQVTDTLEIPNIVAAVGTGGPDALGHNRGREWRVKVSMIYRVTDTDKLRGLLKRVFVGS
jgi:long-subunit fatty acid transport protein